ncbi:right-handed parallel beta-helix repeat-containing protein [Clostridium algoriphilum]|uniref:glycosyl hydrolase family 28-related protein n=1 Tax=Clostridium algoriphilum TaxID=198347 RepID=UPI001CF0EF95|nr:glycosyl hydrolase family 28-related protein [Clostridium algoriphilum]MCB2295343.1 right-handed parallel beta-helix repeat-containing protein [Clostridium algoriphilum]
MFKEKITAIILSTFIIFTLIVLFQITVYGSESTNIEVNVKEFGASGDGSTNDTKAIFDAFKYIAKTETSGVVYFPAGDYLVNTTITVPTNVSIKGDGQESTRIKRIDTSKTAIFNLKGNQSIKDIGFRSQINLYPTGDDITIVDCKISGITQGIQNAATINRLTISNTLFDKCGYGILSNNVPSYDVTISDCNFISSTADDIEINSSSKRWLIQNCDFKDNISKYNSSGFGIGVAVGATEITINNCNFLNMACQAIHIEDNSQVNITKCTFKNSGLGGHPGSPHSDIALLSSATANISDCVFLKSDSGYSSMGIYSNNSIIKGCKFYEKWCGYSSNYYNCEFYGDSSLDPGSRIGKGIDSLSATKIVSDCKFYNLSVGVEYGYLGAGSYGGTVQNCVFNNCDTGAGSKRTSTMIYAGASEMVENNLFESCIVGVSLPNGGDAPRRNYTVVNNLFSGCETNLILGTFIPGYERLVSNNNDLPSINNISVDKEIIYSFDYPSFSVDATGGSGEELTYKYVIENNNTTVYDSGFVKSPKIQFKPREAGSYNLKVYVNDISPFENTKAYSFNVEEAMQEDINLDKTVDIYDLVMISKNLDKQRGRSEDWNERLNVEDSDDVINILDLAKVSKKYNY